MSASLAFVLAPESGLPPDGPTDWDQLLLAQRHGIREAAAFRLYALPEAGLPALTEPGLGLEALPFNGTIPEGLPQAAAAQLYCDAVIPRFDPPQLWLAVYALEDDRTKAVALDRFPLHQAENEACWFYPTDDGTYLCWERAEAITLAPGFIADPSCCPSPSDYRRSCLHLLWSLMADDPDLTCVGITYAGVRLEWPVLSDEPAAGASWTAFDVNSAASPHYRQIATVRAHGPQRSDSQASPSSWPSRQL